MSSGADPAAFLLLLERGKGGEVYNVCNAREGSLDDVLGILRKLAFHPIRTEVDPARMRPADDLRIVGSNRKLNGSSKLSITCSWVMAVDL